MVVAVRPPKVDRLKGEVVSARSVLGALIPPAAALVPRRLAEEPDAQRMVKEVASVPRRLKENTPVLAL